MQLYKSFMINEILFRVCLFDLLKSFTVNFASRASFPTHHIVGWTPEAEAQKENGYDDMHGYGNACKPDVFKRHLRYI
jgi:predicted aconitase